MRKSFDRHWYAWAMVLPTVIVLGVLVFYPLVRGVAQSFTNLNESNQRHEICTKILGNTSFGSGGAPGIGLRRNTGTTFSVDGMAATSSPGVEQYVGGLNPNSQLASGIFQAGDGNYYRAYLISQTTGFTNCTSTA